MRASLARLFSSGPSRFVVEAKLVRRFRRWGLTEPSAVFNLAGEVVSGHADRHVLRVTLGKGPERIAAYLKREHRVRRRDRLAAWWHGFGFASLSEREAYTLAILRKAGVPVPRVLACGQCDHRAFLLLTAVRGSLDLRRYLRQMGAATSDHRRAKIARRLAVIIARVHLAGFDAPDLLSKHVLIQPRTLAISLLDWPRARRRTRVTARIAARDFGRLHASLAASLATPRDRLRCLRAYWHERGGAAFTDFRKLVMAAQRIARAALRRRSVRELQRPPREERPQQLRWLDGEQLCVTRPFFQACDGAPPGWLAGAARSRVVCERRDDVFWRGRRLLLHRWPAASISRRIMARFAGRRVDTMCTRRAGLHFRLRRYGIAVPRVLAFGRRPDGSGFLLTCPVPATQSLAKWLATRAPRRAAVLMRAGALLARLHSAGQRLETKIDALVVSGDRLSALATVDLRPLPRPAGRWPLRDLGLVVRALRLNAGDAARFVRGYLGAGSSVRDGRELAEALRGELPAPRGSQHG